MDLLSLIEQLILFADDLTTLGLTNRPVPQTDTLFSMSQAICTG